MLKPTLITERCIDNASGERWLAEITLTASNGLSARFLNYGATLTNITLPDGTSVVAGYENPADFIGAPGYVGAAIGPVANRIEGGAFSIDDQEYQVTPDEGANLLHSGPDGYHTQFWDHMIGEDANGPFLRLSLFSPDRARGFPSDSWAFIEARLSHDALHLDLRAQVSRRSWINMTMHPYFNPTGAFDKPINGLTLWSPAAHAALNAPDGLPQSLEPVKDTPMDLTDHAILGARALDNHFAVPGTGQRLLATLTDHERYIYVESDAPGLQLYTSDTIPSGLPFVKRGAVAMEPQALPNLINSDPQSTEPLPDLDQPFQRKITYRFAGPGLPELAG